MSACHHCLDGDSGNHPECDQMFGMVAATMRLFKVRGRNHKLASPEPAPGEMRRLVGRLPARDFDMRGNQAALDRLLVWTWGMDKAIEIRMDRGRGLLPSVADATKGFGD
jgi:hypothetical protein